MSVIESKEVIETFQAHNDYRQQVLNGEIEMLPKAKYMKNLEWDESLEKEAQRQNIFVPLINFNQEYCESTQKTLT